MKFTELEFQPEIQQAIEKLNFEECTPIQESSMPYIVAGKDVAGLAQTGTGKTAAFLLPLMDRILKSRLEDLEEKSHAFEDWQKNHFILVLVPTRELAEQVFDNFNKLRGESSLRGVSIYGGVSYERQKKALKEGVEFVIATPGRLIDLYKEHLVDLRQVRAIVFDEADRMFDMGFKDDMKYILQRVSKTRQFLVFSATLNFDVLNVAYQFGADPIECNVSKDQAKAENVDDEIFHIGHDEKPTFLISLLKAHQPHQAIIFSNFKMNVGRIAQFLSDNGVPAVGISSLLTQAQRNRVMQQFKGENNQNILVATDVAARGLDIKGVDMVINYELPDDPENYVHRIGRTGRAGSTGKAFSLVSDRDVSALARIEEYLKNKVAIGWMDDTQLISDYKPFPERSLEARRPSKGFKESERHRENRKGKRKPRREGTRVAGGERTARKTRGPSQEEKSADGTGHTHRDRKTGRHKAKTSRDRSGREERRKQPGKALRGGRRVEDRAFTAKSKRGRGVAKPATKPTSPAQRGLGKKISGFLKKLFS